MALVLFRLCVAGLVDVVPDEAYYWLWSRSLSTGYYDHPPMIAWWIRAGTALLGATSIGIRVVPVFSGLVVSAAVYGICRDLRLDRRIAAMAALWTNATFLIAGAMLLATPDAPSVMFWSLAVWGLARLRRTAVGAWWLGIGAVAGLGCVAKYSNLFLGLGIVLWVFADPKARGWLRSPWPYLGGVIALAVFLPVIIWNAQHDWVSFAKQFGRITDGHLTLRYLGEFVGGQFALLNPLVAIFAGLAVFRLRRTDVLGGISPAGFLMVLSAPLALYMLVHAFHDRVQGNWPAPIYPALAILAAMAAGNPTNGGRLRGLARWVLPVGLGLQVVGLGYVAVAGPAGLPFRTPLDQVAGWDGLTRTLDDMREDSSGGWIATVDYGLTGELALHAEDPDHVQEVIDRDRYSFERPNPALARQPALLVLRGRDPETSRFAGCFQSVEPLGWVARTAGSRVAERYKVYRPAGPAEDILSKGCTLR
ncbi:glycosyltransferase family 39 protein [Aurantimonas sp. VKM B-3413]|uniref:ArnT family glycosyltransferase n=1 Tax=Aurantimonas sp. VKM B-3413 TaxID=2779401 RepID=UPI001E4E5F3F|nr:glycosyltransferase family 39 protein [Aurantimonas sp. VKM B-3413]MCB8840530.1 glycosyltransferase family 39 protein [Aurantimonas sp. VKM B-3413]